jgi:hypothetical protein
MWLYPVPIGIGPGRGGSDCYRELRRIPLLGTSVNKGKKRKDRARRRRRRRTGVLVENKDSGPPFGQGESLLL